MYKGNMKTKMLFTYFLQYEMKYTSIKLLFAERLES